MIALVCVLGACENNNPAQQKEKLYGMWQVTKVEQTYQNEEGVTEHKTYTQADLPINLAEHKIHTHWEWQIDEEKAFYDPRSITEDLRQYPYTFEKEGKGYLFTIQCSHIPPIHIRKLTSTKIEWEYDYADGGYHYYEYLEKEK